MFLLGKKKKSGVTELSRHGTLGPPWLYLSVTPTPSPSAHPDVSTFRTNPDSNTGHHFHPAAWSKRHHESCRLGSSIRMVSRLSPRLRLFTQQSLENMPLRAVVQRGTMTHLCLKASAAFCLTQSKSQSPHLHPQDAV